ncbi:hypothetical protein C8F01DRAFT_1377497 [Mycena amicta]|nr:hypothetical protein C8F01DRAFT_1377497 [Mycena amicta]
MASAPRTFVSTEPLTADNVAFELKKADDQRATFKKMKKETRKGKYPPDFEKTVDERITACRQLQADTPAQEGGIAPPGGPTVAPPAKRPNPDGGGSPDGGGPVPPRHKKIRTYDAVDVLKGISAITVTEFTAAWQQSVEIILAATTSQSANILQIDALYDSAEEIIEQVEDKAREFKIALDTLQWPVKPDALTRDLTVGEITGLQNWLVGKGVWPASVIEYRAPVKDISRPKIRVAGKLKSLSKKDLITARLDASYLPEVVENGLELVKQVFINRDNKQKCVSCESLRGHALAARLAPTDGSKFLDDCKCPVSTAALELWMIKATASNGDVLKRFTSEQIEAAGEDDETKKARSAAEAALKFNTSNLKMVGAAIKAASGLSVEDLLQPKALRQSETAVWALESLSKLAGESTYAASFDQLAKILSATMVHWETEVTSDGKQLRDL